MLKNAIETLSQITTTSNHLFPVYRPTIFKICIKIKPKIENLSLVNTPLEVNSNIMRSINSRFTYLLYLLTLNRKRT